MTNPIKMTPRQYKRLIRNTGAPVVKDEPMGDILLALWEAWEIGKGRMRTIEDIEKHKTELLYIARKYSKHVGKKGQKQNGKTDR
jgi:hypothetical protein